ncbi:forkhead box protein C2 [Histoplasma capsulatum var. duboisii H88]|uniref:Forkhead box protein C2 n=1 Tax=Ajellomyces capsulatus (strain H88) TaxID=544711 RepID=A0A8A1L710_AJEC8|nr:forkhead box protein C2 [Histoplasma capsulatum var. duboisii H88]
MMLPAGMSLNMRTQTRSAARPAGRPPISTKIIATIQALEMAQSPLQQRRRLRLTTRIGKLHHHLVPDRQTQLMPPLPNHPRSTIAA